MTPQEFEYIQRAIKALEGPLEIQDRIKIQRTMAEILAKSTDKLEGLLVDTLDV